MNSSVLYSLSSGKDFDSSDLEKRSKRESVKLKMKYNEKTSWGFESMINDAKNILYDNLNQLVFDYRLFKLMGVCLLLLSILLIFIGLFYSMYNFLIN
jgi:hypothetical protein